jgi:hypothetical protein
MRRVRRHLPHGQAISGLWGEQAKVKKGLIEKAIGF